MKIQERIENIEGVGKCLFDYDGHKLTCFIPIWKDIERIKLSVVKTITDLQLQDSINTFDFIEA